MNRLLMDQPLQARNEEERWVLVLSRSSTNSNSTYKCPLCDLVFTGSAQKIRCHFFEGKENGAVMKECTATVTARAVMITHIKRKREASGGASSKEVRSSPSTGPLTQAFGTSKNEDADASIQTFLAATDTAPNVLRTAAWRKMTEKIVAAGPSYSSPWPPDCGLGRKVLGKMLAEVTHVLEDAVRGFEYTGATLCSDGVKNVKRQCLNTVLQRGVLFLQSTDASGVACKNAEYLQQDINKAIGLVGKQNAFIVCMDGACKKTLKLLEAEHPKIFGQRCATHRCNLLYADIGKLFPDPIKLVVRLMRMVLNHTFLLHTFSSVSSTIFDCLIFMHSFNPISHPLSPNPRVIVMLY
jgi:hypothetical protein